jgi:hypothetical protein
MDSEEDGMRPMAEPSATPRAWVGLCVAALLLGSGTSLLVWLFNEAIDAIDGFAFDTVAPALGPVGGWPVVVVLAAAGLLVWLIVRFMRPTRVAALGYIIDGVAENEGRLEAHTYRLLAPLMLAAAIGYGLARPFQPGSAYTFVFPGLGIRLHPGRFSIMKVNG